VFGLLSAESGSVEVAVLLVLAGALAMWLIALTKQGRRDRADIVLLREGNRHTELALAAAGLGVSWCPATATGGQTPDVTMNRMLGYDQDQTRTILDDRGTVHPDDAERIRTELDRSIRDRTPYSTVYRVIRTNGSVHWVRAQGRPLYTASGVLEAMAGATVDITERRAVEAELQASEEKFAKAFRGSPNCIAIWDLETGRILDVNGHFEDLTGYTRVEMLDRTLVDLGIIEAPEHEVWVQKVHAERAIRDHESLIRRKSGDTASVVTSAELIEIGGRMQFMSVSSEITGRPPTEDALLRTEAKYRELVENANDIIFTVDREGYCLSMNPAGQTIRGYAAEASHRTRLTDLVVPDQADVVREHLQRVLSGEDVPALQLDVHHVEGGRITLEVSLRPVFDRGRLVAAQGIARDMTARKELEAQLRQALKMDAVGQLAAGIAHDFNNLLTIILGNCEIIAPLLGPNDRLLQPMSDISTAAERATSLTAQLLAYSRRQIVLPRVLDLNEVITEIRRMLIRLIGEDIDVLFRAGDDLWRVMGDQGQLEQVIVNLAVNARDAMPQGGRLTIETANHRFHEPFVENHVKIPMGDYVLLTVTDTGVGMNESTLERLYEPFFTTKMRGEGTGLGLSTVYGIVKQSGGYIFADSSRGAGTCFRVLLPRTEGALVPAFAQPRPDQSAAGREALLIVEDEPDVRELLREYLAALGYDVLTAASGDECIGLCRTHATTPAVLVSDIVMPGMNGRDLAERLRTEYPDLRVLFMSGYSDNALVRQARLAPGTHFLQKPFKLLALAKRIREMIDTPVA
jgi:PAS domain S-box-containing protein